MELIQEYLAVRKKQFEDDYRYVFGEDLKDREDWGECHEILQNPHSNNKLRVRAVEGSVRIFRNGIMLVEGADFYVRNQPKGAWVNFPDENQESLRGDRIEVIYLGYSLKGDNTPWS